MCLDSLDEEIQYFNPKPHPVWTQDLGLQTGKVWYVLE